MRLVPQVAGLGGGEVLAQLCDGSGGAARWQRVESDSQRAVAGVDVAAAGQRLADEGVGFVVSAALAGASPEVAPEMTTVPPGLSELIEWDHVAAPTVSITASTRSGSRSPDANA